MGLHRKKWLLFNLQPRWMAYHGLPMSMWQGAGRAFETLNAVALTPATWTLLTLQPEQSCLGEWLMMIDVLM